MEILQWSDNHVKIKIEILLLLEMSAIWHFICHL